jgi:negative regulator of sigma E activity
MTRDELEFAISQYLDGNLAEAQESALEARLATDAEARALLAEYRSLDRVLRAAPKPAVDHDELASRIRGAVEREAAPAQSYRLHWVRTVSAFALAACVVIAAAVGIRRLTMTDRTGQNPMAEAPAKQIIVVDAMTRPAVSTQPVAIVSVGPPANPQDRSAFARYDEDLLSRPSQVIIARSGYPAQDGATQDGLPLP